jgi:hypothetical protein
MYESRHVITGGDFAAWCVLVQLLLVPARKWNVAGLGSTDLLLQAMNRAMGIPVPLFWIGWLGRSWLLGERERDDMKKLTVRHGIDQAKACIHIVTNSVATAIAAALASFSQAGTSCSIVLSSLCVLHAIYM